MNLDKEYLKKFRVYRWYHGKRAEWRINKIRKDLAEELTRKYPDKYPKGWDKPHSIYDEDHDFIKDTLVLSLLLTPVSVVALPILLIDKIIDALY